MLVLYIPSNCIIFHLLRIKIEFVNSINLDFKYQICYLFLESSNTPICEKKDDICATKARKIMEIKLYDEDFSLNSTNISEM